MKRRWVGERRARKISTNSCHTGSIGLGLRAVGQNKEFSQFEVGHVGKPTVKPGEQ